MLNSLPKRMLISRSWLGLFTLTLSVVAAPSVAQTPDANQQLEQARQRLIEQGGQLTPAPTPTPTSNVQTAPNPQFDRYRLGPGDAIFASVLRFSDLSFQATIDLEGNIIVPLAGRVSLRGLTLTEAQSRIQAALNRFVVNPVVAVTLVAQRSSTLR